MIEIIITLISALSISGVAAYYSIFGLSKIFAAATVPIIIMGTVLEVGKLITASWLYRNWKTTNILLKTYLTTACVVLMLITSMGIFGFLSSAHIEQSVGADQNVAKIERLQQQITYNETQIEKYQDSIISSTRDLDLLNKYLAEGNIELVQGLVGVPVDGLYGKNTAQKVEEFRTKAEAKYDESRVENWHNLIRESEIEIQSLSKEKFELEADYRILEAEFGPIKYIAELFHDVEDDGNILDEVVRWVIVAIVFVFDPLAVLLVIAANISLDKWSRERKKLEPSEEETYAYDEPSSVDHILMKTNDGWKRMKKVKVPTNTNNEENLGKTD